MKDKKLYIMAIVAGCLLVIGALFIVLAKNVIDSGDKMSSLDYFLVGAGTVFSMSAMITIFIIIVKILKEKKII